MTPPTGKRLDRPRLSKQEKAVVVTLAIASLCPPFMITLVIPIQASLPEFLDAPRNDTAWVVTAALFTSAVIGPVAGRLGDMYGKRRVALTLLSIGILGSIIAALSPSILGVIVGRALQGVLVGILPLGVSILRDILPDEHVDSAVALVSSVVGIGAALGLPVSGIVSDHTNWRVLFWITAALTAVAFLMVLRSVPPKRARRGQSVRLPRRRRTFGRARRCTPSNFSRPRVGLVECAHPRLGSWRCNDPGVMGLAPMARCQSSSGFTGRCPEADLVDQHCIVVCQFRILYLAGDLSPNA